MTEIIRRRPNIDTCIERQIVTGMIISQEFCNQVFPIYSSAYLRSQFTRTVAEWCKDYYEQYSRPPGKEIKDIYQRHKKGDLDLAQAELIQEFLSSISQEYEQGEQWNAEYYVDNAKQYFRLSALEDHRYKLTQCIAGGRIEEGETLAESFRRVPTSNVPETEGYTLQEVINLEITQSRWVVPGIIPVGLTLLAGKPKIGKSSLVLNIAIDLATGRKVFDAIQTDAVGVLYLALEDTKQRIRLRSVDILQEDKPAGDLFTVFPQDRPWPRLNEGGLERLEQWMAEKPETKLIIVDTLQKIRKRQKKAGHFYSEDYEALTPLQELAGKYNIAVIAVHHTRKTKGEDVFDEISGTTGLTGVADTLAVMSRPINKVDVDRVLAVRGRDIEDKQLAFKLSSEYRWVLAGDAADFAATTQRQTIMDYLRQAGEPVKRAVLVKDLSDKVGKGIDVLIRKLVEDGSIENPSRGYYACRGYGREQRKDKVVQLSRQQINERRRRRRTV